MSRAHESIRLFMWTEMYGSATGGARIRKCSSPTCEMRPDQEYLDIVPTGVPRYCESNESVNGTSNVIWLPEICSIVRSVVMTVPALSHVWVAPLRTSVSIPK